MSGVATGPGLPSRASPGARASRGADARTRNAGPGTTVEVGGQADLRARERVRGHLHAPRPAPTHPDEVARYLFRRVVSWGRSSNVFLENGARLYLDVGSHPEYATPECDSIADSGGPRQGGGADPRPSRHRGRGAPARRGDPRRHLPLQEQHRLGRQFLRLPRELPDQPARRLRPLHRDPHPVPGQPPDLRRSGQGAADGARCGVLPVAAGRAHLGGRVVGDHPEPARSSTPATSLTPTPSGSAACTSSWATRT